MSQATPSATESTFRGRHRDLTRRLIVDAFTRVALRDGMSEFSMQAVAEEAECSLRTLYRYFPSREALLSGLDAELEAYVRSCFERAEVSESADLADLVERITPSLAERRDLVLVWSAAGLATPLHGWASERGRSHVDAAIRRAAPNLPPDEYARVFAALRQVVTLRGLLSLTERLTGDDAALTGGWMVRTLLADLANGGGPKRNEP
jgi:AcrR family transcriptional regulator